MHGSEGLSTDSRRSHPHRWEECGSSGGGGGAVEAVAGDGFAFVSRRPMSNEYLITETTSSFSLTFSPHLPLLSQLLNGSRIRFSSRTQQHLRRRGSINARVPAPEGTVPWVHPSIKHNEENSRVHEHERVFFWRKVQGENCRLPLSCLPSCCGQIQKMHCWKQRLQMMSSHHP